MPILRTNFYIFFEQQQQKTTMNLEEKNTFSEVRHIFIIIEIFFNILYELRKQFILYVSKVYYGLDTHMYIIIKEALVLEKRILIYILKNSTA